MHVRRTLSTKDWMDLFSGPPHENSKMKLADFFAFTLPISKYLCIQILVCLKNV